MSIAQIKLGIIFLLLLFLGACKSHMTSEPLQEESYPSITEEDVYDTAYHVDASYTGATSDGTKTYPWKTISEAANSDLKPGNVVIVHGGTYRETVNVKSSGTKSAPIYFMAKNGEDAIIKGSDIVSDWKKEDGCIYSHDNWSYKVPWLPNPDNNTILGLGKEKSAEYDSLKENWDEKINFLRNNKPEALYSLMRGQVFVDEEPLKEVIAYKDVVAGTFYIDPSNSRLYVCLQDSSNPNEHVIEGSSRDTLVQFDKDSSCVVFKGFQIRHSTSPIRTLPPASGSYAVIIDGTGHYFEDNEIKYINGSGISISETSDHSLKNNIITLSGHTGISSYEASNITLSGNTTSFNGFRTMYLQKGWEAGGMKLGMSSAWKISNHKSYYNYYHGLWFDSGCYGNRISDSIFYGNDVGIRLESCDGKYLNEGNVISNNLIYSNVYGIWYDGSSFLDISNNLITFNFYSGIGVSEANDGSKNNNITQNFITHNGITNIRYNVEKDNSSFYKNIYYLDSSDAFLQRQKVIEGESQGTPLHDFFKEYFFTAGNWNPSIGEKFGKNFYSVTEWQKEATDIGSKIENPLYRNSGSADYCITSSSLKSEKDIGPSNLYNCE